MPPGKNYNKTQLTFTAFNRTKPFSSVYSPTRLCRYTKEIHKGSIYAVPAGKDHLGGKQDLKFLKRNLEISSMPKVTSHDNWPSFSIFLNPEFISTILSIFKHNFLKASNVDQVATNRLKLCLF